MHHAHTDAAMQINASDDAPWLDQARAGDAEAFATLCERYDEKLFRQALALCGNAATAEELAQETLIAAWHGLPKFRGQCQWFTWLCGILIRLHHRSFRRNRPMTVSRLSASEQNEMDFLLEQSADPGVPPDSLLQLGEREGTLRSCLARLPEKHRQVIHLRFYVDTSLEGIAEALGCSVGTVKSRLFHALKKLAAMSELKNILVP